MLSSHSRSEGVRSGQCLAPGLASAACFILIPTQAVMSVWQLGQKGVREALSLGMAPRCGCSWPATHRSQAQFQEFSIAGRRLAGGGHEREARSPSALSLWGEAAEEL